MQSACSQGLIECYTKAARVKVKCLKEIGHLPKSDGQIQSRLIIYVKSPLKYLTISYLESGINPLNLVILSWVGAFLSCCYW